MLRLELACEGGRSAACFALRQAWRGGCDECLGALAKGETLSRAAIAGREAAAKEEDGTWLAYVVYGYPHATMKVE